MLGTERILALDIGASSVKAGEFHAVRGQGLRLMAFGFADLGIDPEHDENRKQLVLSAIRELIREKGIKTSRVMFTVSGQSVFTRFVKLPPVDESKVVQIIQYEAQQNVPFPIDEVIWNYQLLGSTAQGELEVVLLAIKNDIIEELNQGIESAGLNTEIVDVAPMALYNAVRYNYPDMPGCTMVLDIGARTTNLLFLEQNKLFSRSIPIAGNAITQGVAAEFNVSFLDAERMKRAKGFVALGGAYEEPEDETQARVSKTVRNVMTRLHAEVARTINFYRGQQGGSAPARLLLAGGSSILPHTDWFFHEKFQLPVEHFNPFRNVQIDPRVAREDLARCAHFLGEVVGIGLRKVTDCPVEVNLLPKTLRRRQQIRNKYPYFAGAAAALLLIPLCWWLYAKKTIELRQKELEFVTDQVRNLQSLHQQITGEQRRLTDLREKADRIVALVSQRFIWMEMLQEINQQQVPNIWLISFSPQALAGGEPTPARTATSGSRGGRLRRFEEDEAAPEHTPTMATGQVVTEIRIEAAGQRTPGADPGEAYDLPNRFVQNLQQSSWFDPTGVALEGPPQWKDKDPIFTFSLRAKLKTPIHL
jgi:type IV pilus assembly protein PilM